MRARRARYAAAARARCVIYTHARSSVIMKNIFTRRCVDDAPRRASHDYYFIYDGITMPPPPRTIYPPLSLLILRAATMRHHRQLPALEPCRGATIPFILRTYPNPAPLPLSFITIKD